MSFVNISDNQISANATTNVNAFARMANSGASLSVRGLDPAVHFTEEKVVIEPNQIADQFVLTDDYDKNIDQMYELSMRAKPVYTDTVFNVNDLSSADDRKRNEEVQKYYNGRKYKYTEMIQKVKSRVAKLTLDADAILGEIVEETFVQDIIDQPDLFRDRYTDKNGVVHHPFI